MKNDTGDRVSKVFETRLKTNPNEVYKDKLKNKANKEPEIERFYRKLNMSAAD